MRGDSPALLVTECMLVICARLDRGPFAKVLDRGAHNDKLGCLLTALVSQVSTPTYMYPSDTHYPPPSSHHPATKSPLSHPTNSLLHLRSSPKPFFSMSDFSPWLTSNGDGNFNFQINADVVNVNGNNISLSLLASTPSLSLLSAPPQNRQPPNVPSAQPDVPEVSPAGAPLMSCPDLTANISPTFNLKNVGTINAETGGGGRRAKLPTVA